MPSPPSLLVLAATRFAVAAGIPVVHGAIQVIAPQEVQVGRQPVVALAVPDRQAVIYVECTVLRPDGSPQTFTHTTEVLAPGTATDLALDVVPPVSSARCLLVANFANGLSERRPLDLSWRWVEVPAPQEEAPPPEEPPPSEALPSETLPSETLPPVEPPPAESAAPG